MNDQLVLALRSLAQQIYDMREGLPAEDYKRMDHAGLSLEVLAHVVNGKPLRIAFGAPGDWGYNTDMGKAILATLKDGGLKS